MLNAIKLRKKIKNSEEKKAKEKKMLLCEGSIAGIVIIETHTQEHILKTYSSSLLVCRPKARTKTVESLKGIHLYLLRNKQYIEVDSNW